MRQWHKAVARSMHWSDTSEQILVGSEQDPHLANSMPQYKRRSSSSIKASFAASLVEARWPLLTLGLGIGIGVAIMRFTRVK